MAIRLLPAVPGRLTDLFPPQSNNAQPHGPFATPARTGRVVSDIIGPVTWYYAGGLGSMSWLGDIIRDICYMYAAERVAPPDKKREDYVNKRDPQQEVMSKSDQMHAHGGGYGNPFGR